MKRISGIRRGSLRFDWRDQPLLRVKCGESIEIETWDAGSGFFKSPDDKAIPANRPGFDKHPPLANPIGGPVFIEGAEPGDVLTIEIEDILVGNTSWIAIGPNRGPLGQSTRWTEVSENYTTKIFSITPGKAARCATARCSSAIPCRGRSRRSSAPSASPRSARSAPASTARVPGAVTSTSATWPSQPCSPAGVS